MQLKFLGCAAVVACVLTAAPAHAETSSNATWLAKPSISLQSLLGARVSTFATNGPEPAATGGGASVQNSGYITLSYLTLRATGMGSLGSSRAGFEGMYTGDFALGGIVPVGEGHGPFARVGMRGYALGNEQVWLSNFEIPSGFVGYQYQDGRLLLEAAGRTGLIVTGRHTHYATVNGFDVLERRRLGQPSLEIGGHAAVGYDMFRAEVEYMRVNVADTIGTPMQTWTVSACLRPSWWGGCLDYRSWEADVPRIDGTTTPLAVAYGGVSFGIWSP